MMDTKTWQEKVEQLKALGLQERSSLADIYAPDAPNGITGDVMDILHILPSEIILAGFKEQKEIFSKDVQINYPETSLKINMHIGHSSRGEISWTTPDIENLTTGTAVTNLSKKKNQADCFRKFRRRKKGCARQKKL